jgi:hypothetical protein
MSARTLLRLFSSIGCQHPKPEGDVQLDSQTLKPLRRSFGNDVEVRSLATNDRPKRDNGVNIRPQADDLSTGRGQLKSAGYRVLLNVGFDHASREERFASTSGEFARDWLVELRDHQRHALPRSVDLRLVRAPSYHVTSRSVSKEVAKLVALGF